jgi:hypothetical protein
MISEIINRLDPIALLVMVFILVVGGVGVMAYYGIHHAAMLKRELPSDQEPEDK